MAGRRWLLAVVFLAVALHGIGIARSTLPAQDGLKFIKVAREFQRGSWWDAIRGTDQHPLYPALVAAVEPLIALLKGGGHGPDTWRTSAQVVAACASILLLYPLYRLTESLFDRRIATLAVAIYALLPLPAGWGREALADSVGLCALMFSLQLGALAARHGSWRAGIGSGAAAGIGYLARPEIILAPAAAAAAVACGRFRKGPAFAALAISALVPVGAYALVKGEVSEKLALRYATTRIDRSGPTRKTPQWLPAGLDDRRWDFSPKEESERPAIANWRSASTRILAQWWRELAGIFAVMFGWGLVRRRFIRGLCLDRRPEDRSAAEQITLLAFPLIYTLALARHCTMLGYLSERHTLALVLASTPWAAAGTYVCLRGLAVKFGWTPRFARTVRFAFACAVAATIIHFQLRDTHASRAGHLEAGRWLAGHGKPGEAVLDTRGWASFVADRSSADCYDYWHVRQALTDSRLSYIVVEADEIEAESRRAETLRALLAYAAEPIRDFPTASDDEAGRVRIYRFHRPDDWKGILR
jgi:4-amino-4-deoxy-L-arabinose transferase-like glycosyltransferase